jgi:hypothetical protein
LESSSAIIWNFQSNGQEIIFKKMRNFFVILQIVIFSIVVSIDGLPVQEDVDGTTPEIPNINYMYRINPEEIVGDIEGDIMVTENQRHSKSGLLSSQSRWPGAVIPYRIDTRDFNTYYQSLILSAMAEISKYTCIKFREKTFSDYDYIDIRNGTGCSSFLGRVGGAQRVSLLNSNGATCMIKGIIMHELIHSIGYRHMHSSADRDDYVTINYASIAYGAESNFKKYTEAQVSNFGTPYDYDSIMHYSKWAFTRDGRDTIITRDKSYADKIGQRVRLSNGDITRINRMYNCFI